MKTFRTQPTQTIQPTELAARAESTASKFARKPKLSMIWVMETVGNRTRLVARWTTQD